MNKPLKKLAVLVSGGGSNLQAILDAADLGNLGGTVSVVISSNPDAYALVRAKKKNIPAFVFRRADYESAEKRDGAILNVLLDYQIDFVILAGYLGILTGPLVNAFPNRIINIHPALLPKFGGKDYHGLAVHKAVLDAGETESGATVHFVDGGIDTGKIIAQERLAVLPDDTPESLQERILTQIEHKLLVRTVTDLCADSIRVENGKVVLRDGRKTTGRKRGKVIMKKRALISVSDKTGVVAFAKELQALGYELISTGGTAKTLSDAGINNLGISEITGFPECLDGRVKTLHPAVHAGVLAMRDNPEHMEQLKQLGIETIDIVAVNLYPFKATIEKPGVEFADAVENIDIGGPTMIRAAAKNYGSVCVVVDPADYMELIDKLKSGTVDTPFRELLQYKVFAHTAAYDAMISNFLAKRLGIEFPAELTLSFTKKQDLRYGENPHQKGAFYADSLTVPHSLATAEQLGGKELSYNNISDAHGALDLLNEFSECACVAVKHANPCGAAIAETPLGAYKAAYECDPISIYGGIVALNRKVDAATAEELVKIFLEIIIAPDFDAAALQIFKTKPNLRILRIAGLDQTISYRGVRDLKRIYGGLLVQDKDATLYDNQELKIVTKRKPTKDELAQMQFAYKVVKHVKSNGIALANHFAAVGTGGGQTNRIWAAKQAIEHAGPRAKGAVLGSDAFFPFSDCVEAAAAAGITAIIQPGGSVRDQDSIDLCDKYGIAMVFVGQRHFKH